MSSSDHIDSGNPANPVLATFLHGRTSTEFTPLRGRYDDYDYRDDGSYNEDDYADQGGDGRRSSDLGLAISGVGAHLPTQHHRRTSGGISLSRKPAGTQSSPRSPWTPNMNISASEPLLAPTSPPPPPVSLPRGLRLGQRQQSPEPSDREGGGLGPPSGGGGVPLSSSRGQSPDDSLMRKKLLGGKYTKPSPSHIP
jgi:hypothetical protein